MIFACRDKQFQEADQKGQDISEEKALAAYVEDLLRKMNAAATDRYGASFFELNPELQDLLLKEFDFEHRYFKAPPVNGEVSDRASNCALEEFSEQITECENPLSFTDCTYLGRTRNGNSIDDLLLCDHKAYFQLIGSPNWYSTNVLLELAIEGAYGGVIGGQTTANNQDPQAQLNPSALANNDPTSSRKFIVGQKLYFVYSISSATILEHLKLVTLSC